MLKGFKEFIMRGNVIDLAVAFVIGLAFGQVVTAIVDGLINPIIAAIFGKTDLTGVMSFTINDARFSIGLILDALINFLAVAAAVYFLIVMPMNKLAERRARGAEPEPDPLTVDQQLLTEIRDSLRTRP
jgi:large conductance mechanosensitive channel